MAKMTETDLISRQAAIDAIENTDWYHQNANKDMVSGANPDTHQAWYKADDVYKTLESVQSAQPELKWIPCSERLPKENGHYLVTFHQTATEEDLGFDMDDTDVRKMRYDTKHGWRTPRRIPSWINDAVVSTVLAWMPLPEAWKGEHDG